MAEPYPNAPQAAPGAVQPMPQQPQQQPVHPLVEISRITTNMVPMLDANLIAKINKDAGDEYRQDKASMDEWNADIDLAMELAKMDRGEKTFPWESASNVKLPMIQDAVLKWSAKAYTKLLQGKDWVKAEQPGMDKLDKEQDKAVFERAARTSEYLNHQLQYEMDDWEEDFDKLLHCLPWVGCLHKLVYQDPNEQRIVSDLLPVRSVVVHKGTKSLDRARFSINLELLGNEYREMVNAGLYEDVGLASEQIDGRPESDEMRAFVETYGWYDIDGDGYKEPYIVTRHTATDRVVRIRPRFSERDISFDPQTGRVIRIRAESYLIKYSFYQSSDLSYWSIGWGHLVGALNRAANTLTNQLIDAGTAANAIGGFADSRMRSVDGGPLKFKPGEFKRVKSSLPRLADAFHQFEFRDASPTLFSLLQLIDTKLNALAISPEIASQSLPANAPVGTTLARLDEAEKVNNAVDKRIYRAMTREFQRIYYLTAMYGSPKNYVTVLNLDVQNDQNAGAIFMNDFNMDDMDVMPTANPETSSRVMRLSQADYAMQQGMVAAQMGVQIDMNEIYLDSLRAAGIENPERYLKEPTPEEIQAAEEQADIEEYVASLSIEERQEAVLKARAERLKTEAETQTERVEPAKTKAETEKLKSDARNNTE